LLYSITYFLLFKLSFKNEKHKKKRLLLLLLLGHHYDISPTTSGTFKKQNIKNSNITYRTFSQKKEQLLLLFKEIGKKR